MKVKKLMPFLAILLLSNYVFPVLSSAESLDSLQEKEENATETGQALSEEINTALNDVNEKYAEIEKLKSDISTFEQQLKAYEEEIVTVQDSINRRKEVVGDRMKDIQLSGGDRTWQVLLDAESFTDFFNKVYAMNVLQNAEKEKINSLSKDKETLNELQKNVEKKQVELQESETKLNEEAVVMNEQVAGLKEQLSNNQELLAQISVEKKTETKRIADEAAAAKAAKEKEIAEQQAAAEAAALAQTNAANSLNGSSTTTESSTNTTTNTNTVTPDTGIDSGISGGTGAASGNGQVLYVQSTAYSWTETGYSITATGIDLKQQSNVIAVDPSVIPLGSLVQVDGYGFAIAGDTGGAIKGNIVDVHFNSVSECIAWGRRYNVRVEIVQ